MSHSACWSLSRTAGGCGSARCAALRPPWSCRECPGQTTPSTDRPHSPLEGQRLLGCSVIQRPTVLRVDVLPPTHRQPHNLGLQVHVGRALEPIHHVADTPELQGYSDRPLSLCLVEQRSSEGAANSVENLNRAGRHIYHLETGCYIL